MGDDGWYVVFAIYSFLSWRIILAAAIVGILARSWWQMMAGAPIAALAGPFFWLADDRRLAAYLVALPAAFVWAGALYGVKRAMRA